MSSLARFVDLIFSIIYLLLIARIILTFISANRYGNPSISKAYEIIWRYTEPFLKPIRRLIPPTSLGGGYIDFSPVIAILLLNLIQSFVIQRILLL